MASETTTIVTTGRDYDLADGSHSISARQREPDKAQSVDSAPLSVTIDTLAPTARWEKLAKLLPGDGAAGDWFGVSVSISGDTAIVGACGDYSLNDLSLRESLLPAAELPGDNVIQFDGGLAGDTITLDPTLGQLRIDSNVEIQGLGSELLAVDAAGNSRVFMILPETQVLLQGLTISGDSTGGNGGGIHSRGTLTLENSTISANYGMNGAGGVSASGTLTVANSTISFNKGSSAGGILASGTLTVANSIVALNYALSDLDVSGPMTAESGSNLFGIDPLFVRNPSAGADGVWGTDDDDWGDLHLTDRSPAIDFGDDALVPPGVVTDLDGNARVYGARVDIGAYRFAAHGYDLPRSPDLVSIPNVGLRSAGTRLPITAPQYATGSGRVCLVL